MARLSDSSKDNLIKNAELTYFAYLRLELLNKKLKIIKNNKEISVGEYIKNNGEMPVDVALGEQQLKLDINDGMLIIQNTSSIINNEKVSIKAIKQYSAEDISKILTEYPFTIQNNAQGDIKFATPLISGEKRYQIGGAALIDLYSFHISNLGKIIQHLNSPKYDNNMLVSLTTGSGKTFTQALWMMVLHLSEVNGVFALPGDLVKQYKGDLQRLIPESMLAKIEHNEGMIIGSAENLLLSEFDKIHALDPQNTVFSFDEAHLLALKENLFVKAKTLATRFVNVFLTATPTPALHDIAKGDDKKGALSVVATMNNKQKVENGYAQPASSYSAPAKSIREMGRKVTMPFSGRLGLFLADSIDKEIGFDAANAFGEAYLYRAEKNHFDAPLPIPKNFTEQDKIRFAIRWSIQPTAYQNKTLICANHFDDIVNLDVFLNQLNANFRQKSEHNVPSLSEDTYVKGNKYNRKTTYEFLQMTYEIDGKDTHLDIQISKAYANNLYNNFSTDLQGKLEPIIRSVGIEYERDLECYVKNWTQRLTAGLYNAPITNSMHGVVEFTIYFYGSN